MFISLETKMDKLVHLSIYSTILSRKNNRNQGKKRETFVNYGFTSMTVNNKVKPKYPGFRMEAIFNVHLSLFAQRNWKLLT